MPDKPSQEALELPSGPVRSECEICEGSCYRESLHRLSPLAVLIDRMEWPHTHGRITLRKRYRLSGWVAEPESRKSLRVALDGDTRSAALTKAISVCLGEEAPDDDLSNDPLASLLDALPERAPFDRIVLRRDQLHIYVYIGKHYGGHGLAEALYSMMRLTEEVPR